MTCGETWSPACSSSLTSRPCVGGRPPGYVFEDLDGRVVLQVGKGVKFAGRLVHHAYWRFLGKRQPTLRGRRITGDRVWFYRWKRRDEMAPGWGGPATAGFALLLGEEAFDEAAHKTDWERAEEALPHVIDGIREAAKRDEDQ